MEEYEYLTKCPIWNEFKTDVKYVWIRIYCEGTKKEECERRKLRKAGKEVPLNLLPNGKTLERFPKQ